jgi:tripartite-type tricarboxylate transporter receptor subunit TctC
VWAMDFLANLEGLGRLLMAPPGIPAARLAFLREAVKETLHNPQLIAEGERMERIIEYTDPEATLRTVTAVVSDVAPEQKTRALKLLSGEK